MQVWVPVPTAGQRAVGEDTGSPIEFSYTPPFKVTGKPGRVTVELK